VTGEHVKSIRNMLGLPGTPVTCYTHNKLEKMYTLSLVLEHDLIIKTLFYKVYNHFIATCRK